MKMIKLKSKSGVIVEFPLSQLQEKLRKGFTEVKKPKIKKTESK